MSASEIELRGIHKNYGAEHVLEHLNLTIKAGSFTVLLGPSGCGKSTILRLMAGFEKCAEGDVLIDGKSALNVEPGDRGIAMVFQNYALYPTMTVEENIEFGMKNAKVPRAERMKRIEEIAVTVSLEPYLKKKPQNLSGGQRQRVALARAMVKNPGIFLMDEPLSNLDAKLRSQLRADLAELHHKIGATFVYVTHDQTEAMSMGTRIILLKKGVIMQDATPDEMYELPANTFSAGFIGTPPMNILPASELGEGFPDGTKLIGFRPEKCTISEMNAKAIDNAIKIEGELIAREMLGSEILYRIKRGSQGLNVRRYEKESIQVGPVDIIVKRSDLVYFGDAGERLR